MQQLILDFNTRLKASLDQINEQITERNFVFSTSELVLFAGRGTEQQCPVWQRLGWQFEQISSPVIYWFALPSGADTKAIHDSVKACKAAQDGSSDSFRYLPAIRNVCPTESQTLNVGACASTRLVDRMFWHLGYYVTGKTQGLQLCHWSRPLELHLTVHTLSFPLEAKELIYMYEKLIAKEFLPIIGK